MLLLTRSGLNRVITIVMLTACSSPSVNNEPDVESEVRDMLDHYYRDIKHEGLLAEFSYLDSSAQFFWVPPGHSGAISFDSVAAILRANAPLYKSIENSWDTLRIIPLSNDLASYTGQLKSVMTDTGGNVSAYALAETGVVIRRTTGWKLLHGQTSMIKQTGQE